ncbi:MAG: hypothetical protein QXU45_02470 [Candidatus Bathyarchaeia archaeon]
MSQADFIREFVFKNYIQPARNRGEKEITITAGDVARRLRLYRIPNICNVLGGRKLQVMCGVRLLERSGPHQSTTTKFTYQILEQPAADVGANYIKPIKQELQPPSCEEVVELLDPYLTDVKEKLLEAEQYLKGKKISTGIIVTLCYEAVITTLQRMIIDKKGMKPIEDLRKEKKIYFDNLVNILRNSGVNIENITDLEILRDLRNRVVHEGYKPTEQNAKWAYEVVKKFVLKHYPKVLSNLTIRSISNV